MAYGNQVVTISNPAAHGIVSVTYNPATHTLTFTHQDGTVENITLNDKHITNMHVSGSELVLTKEDGSEFNVDLATIAIKGVLTTLKLVGGDQLEYKDENGDLTTIDLSHFLTAADDRTTVSATLDYPSGLVTFTRTDGTTYSMNVNAMKQTLTKLQLSAGHELIYDDENGTSTSLDLTPYDKHVQSGVLNEVAGTLEFTNSDGTTFDVDVRDLKETLTTLNHIGDTLIYEDENGNNTVVDLTAYNPTGKFIPVGEKGANNGVATLDGTGHVPSSQLPSYVDDILEFPNVAAFPATGEPHKIYVAIDTHLLYRWSGTAYNQVAQSLALGETATTAYYGDKGKAAFDHSQVSGNPHGVTMADIPGIQTALDEKVAYTDVKSTVTATNKVMTESDVASEIVNSGDMKKSTYDTNNNGRVDMADNSALVNGLQVLTAVPGGALFTDTQADWNQGDPANAGYILNKPTISNDFTDSDKSKLDGIEPGAQVNVQADWNETNGTSDAFIQNKPDLSVVDGGSF